MIFLLISCAILTASYKTKRRCSFSLYSMKDYLALVIGKLVLTFSESE